MKLRRETTDIIMDALDNGIDDPGEFNQACRIAATVMDRICDFVETHGNIALAFGAEWLYQTNAAQVDALELVADILEMVADYAEEEER